MQVHIIEFKVIVLPREIIKLLRTVTLLIMIEVSLLIIFMQKQENRE